MFRESSSGNSASPSSSSPPKPHHPREERLYDGIRGNERHILFHFFTLFSISFFLGVLIIHLSLWINANYFSSGAYKTPPPDSSSNQHHHHHQQQHHVTTASSAPQRAHNHHHHHHYYPRVSLPKSVLYVLVNGNSSNATSNSDASWTVARGWNMTSSTAY